MKAGAAKPPCRSTGRAYGIGTPIGIGRKPRLIGGGGGGT
jgi:hypothetical protein